jgi:hypothetical protein
MRRCKNVRFKGARKAKSAQHRSEKKFFEIGHIRHLKIHYLT